MRDWWWRAGTERATSDTTDNALLRRSSIRHPTNRGGVKIDIAGDVAGKGAIEVIAAV